MVLYNDILRTSFHFISYNNNHFIHMKYNLHNRNNYYYINQKFSKTNKSGKETSLFELSNRT